MFMSTDIPAVMLVTKAPAVKVPPDAGMVKFP
jgi:hypothetical protein